MKALLLALVMASLLLAACNGGSNPAYQGWVEVNLIFVGPDEAADRHI